MRRDQKKLPLKKGDRFREMPLANVLLYFGWTSFSTKLVSISPKLLRADEYEFCTNVLSFESLRNKEFIAYAINCKAETQTVTKSFTLFGKHYKALVLNRSVLILFNFVIS